MATALWLTLTLVHAAAAPAGLAWRPFEPAALDEARDSGRLVLLDVGTAWCHWCHVMDERTYGDARVQAVLRAGFVVTRADADARLDLAQRYEAYGWPATIVLDAEGRELLRRRGFVPPEAMVALLEATRARPTPLLDVALHAAAAPTAAGLPPPVLAELEARWEAAWEPHHAGWGRVHKLIHAPSVELALYRGARGDQRQAERAAALLEAAGALLDPVDGGVFQYSDRTIDERPWATPHYEKIMASQVGALRAYARAARATARPELEAAARSIARYLTTVLSSPSGAFYASQAADVSATLTGKAYYAAATRAARRALGEPPVDRQLYTRETAQAAAALAEASGLLHDPTLLERARAAVGWARQARRRDDGTYRHGDDDARYLGDTLAMARAASALYLATADRAELADALATLQALDTHWRVPGGGFATAAIPASARGVLAQPVLDLDENLAVVRLAQDLVHATDSPLARQVAAHGWRWLEARVARGLQRYPSGVLLADAERSHAPLHVVVVGPKADAAARALFDAARAHPAPHVWTEWLDHAEGPLASTRVELPRLPAPAAFVCAEARCSSPARTPAALAEAIARLLVGP
jgi:uncharacterized protein YyaL (SSP411 family)